MMRSIAIGTAAEGIVGHWDGTPSVTPPDAPSAGDWERFKALADLPKAAVLAHDLGSLFNVELCPAPPGGQPTVRLNVRSDPTTFTPLLEVTRPTTEDFVQQLKFLRDYMDLRDDRLPEILIQLDDMLSFYGSLGFVSDSRSRWSLLLLRAVDAVTTVVEMRFKHHFSVPRPIEFAPEVTPVIQTPSHSSYPSGHATEAFGMATMFDSLMDPNAQDDGIAKAIDDRPLAFRSAVRIAANRTVAGVHFPVDSAHGALIGLAVAEAVLSHCKGSGPVTGRKASGTGWKGEGNAPLDYTLPIFRKALDGSYGVEEMSAPVAVDPAAEGSILCSLWEEARKEWHGETA